MPSGLETTFAPELTALATSAQGVPLRSQTTSWFPAPSTAADPHLQGRARSPHLSFLPAETRPTRHEKNRLSLTFLKRGSALDPHDPAASGTPPPPPSEPEPGGARAPRSRSRDKVKDRLSFLNSFAPDDVAGARGRPASTQRSASSEDRPDTGRAGAAGQMLVGRVESVKKRFSTFGIRKKTSKSSVRSRVEEGVAEE